eukprot:4047982-Pyramimonas_sp.AAC.1
MGPRRRRSAAPSLWPRRHAAPATCRTRRSRSATPVIIHIPASHAASSSSMTPAGGLPVFTMAET